MTMRCSRSRAGGQVLVEYLVVCTALAAALFLPYVDGRSVVALLVAAMFEWFRAQAFLVSVM
jgi:hypothetical protein